MSEKEVLIQFIDQIWQHFLLLPLTRWKTAKSCIPTGSWQPENQTPHLWMSMAGGSITHGQRPQLLRSRKPTDGALESLAAIHSISEKCQVWKHTLCWLCSVMLTCLVTAQSQQWRHSSSVSGGMGWHPPPHPPRLSHRTCQLHPPVRQLSVAAACCQTSPWACQDLTAAAAALTAGPGKGRESLGSSTASRGAGEAPARSSSVCDKRMRSTSAVQQRLLLALIPTGGYCC